MSLVIHSEAHSLAFARLVSTSKKAAVDLVRQEFGLLLTEVAKVTPPYSEKMSGKKAEVQGRAAVAADIRALYGTPGDAYDAISAPAAKAAFWFLHQSGDNAAASQILRAETGTGLSPFDGGTVHGRRRPGNRRRRQRRVVYYVADTDALDVYIAAEQAHVWWLASGWAPALRALGRRLPYGVERHSAPGTMRAVITDQRIELVAVDSVAFASRVRDIERQIQFALKIRTGAMQRSWDHFTRNVRL
ncbi:MAG TPA: hypothetical protein DIT13_09160 [Verrucomicrobiales bacterium]|nr:hypothetical protein [Verrucomicrobiales bacterium]HRJ09373.1 hypothetical protein [Prosthecobacter sp.]HRK15043.1 hypothetical protein [Prosthecobacter sp.]